MIDRTTPTRNTKKKRSLLVNFSPSTAIGMSEEAAKSLSAVERIA